MTDLRKGWRVALPLYLLSMVLVSVILLAAWMIHHDRAQQERLDQDRRERIAQVNRANLEFCREIERLKLQFRVDAEERYRRLDETLALLGLERTPAIEQRARQDLEATLRRHAANGCPRRVVNS